MDYIQKRRQEILNHLIENKIVEPGQAINAAFFKKIYFPYQEEISKEMGKKGRSWAKGIESGKNRFYFQDFMKICNRYGIRVIIEK